MNAVITTRQRDGFGDLHWHIEQILGGATEREVVRWVRDLTPIYRRVKVERYPGKRITLWVDGKRVTR